MKGFVGVTDNAWFEFLSQQSGIDEVNFWQLAGIGLFRSPAHGVPLARLPYYPLHDTRNLQ